jgi:hypothetical protein
VHIGVSQLKSCSMLFNDCSMFTLCTNLNTSPGGRARRAGGPRGLPAARKEEEQSSNRNSNSNKLLRHCHCRYRLSHSAYQATLEHLRSAPLYRYLYLDHRLTSSLCQHSDPRPGHKVLQALLPIIQNQHQHRAAQSAMAFP